MDKSWTTEHEINFLKGVGRNEFNKEGPPRSRRKCLQGYIDGCAKRVNWGAIDRNEVESFARMCLKFEA